MGITKHNRNPENKEETTYKCKHCGKRAESVADLYSHYQSTEDDDHTEIRERIKSAPSLETVVKTLKERGVGFVAVSTRSLSDSVLQFRYYIAPGGDTERLDTFLRNTVGDVIEEGQVGIVHIDQQPLPVRFIPVLRNGLHLYRRTPVYVDSNLPGLKSVEPSDGISTISELVGQEVGTEAQSTKTTHLSDLVHELADAGAASVELQHEFLAQPRPPLSLRIPMVPAEGVPIVEPIDFVEVAGEMYQLHSQVTMDGPHGPGSRRTPLYVSENVVGLEPISIEEGMEAARTVLNSAVFADSVRDIETPFS